ncbi:MAG: O-antigen ligase family protein [Acidobacteria bacterium]|nr:O-antigen ligase family protein [Acidobacteriota bacterium]
MAFFLTLLYVALNFFRPEELLPDVVQYHPMLVLGVLCLLVSVPTLLASDTAKKSPQGILMLVFLAVVALSEIFSGWWGGLNEVYTHVAPSVICVFLILANVDTLFRIRATMITLLVCSAVLVGQGIAGYYTGYGCDSVTRWAEDPDNAHCKYAMQQYSFTTDESGEHRGGFIWRIRSVGVLEDPNDFAQFMLVLLPLVWIAYRKRHAFRNLFVVFIPTAYFLYGMYLTRSRGGLIGLGFLLLFAFRKRLNTVNATLLSAFAVIGLVALNFAGGRSMSAAAGADRVAAWRDAFMTFRSHPILGVGFNRYNEYAPLTAHNSFLLCAAELGLAGLLVWIALWYVSLADVNRFLKWAPSIATSARKKLASPAYASPFLTRQPAMALAGGGIATDDELDAPDRFPGERMEHDEIAAATEDWNDDGSVHSPNQGQTDREGTIDGNSEAAAVSEQQSGIIATCQRYAGALQMSLIAFLVTGWFLSRTYVVLLYILLALVVVVGALADRESGGHLPERKPWARNVVLTTIATLVVIWVWLKMF